MAFSDRRSLAGSLMLILAALIWGTAFAAQASCGDVVGSYTYNCIRSLVAAIVLTPVIGIFDRTGKTLRRPVTPEDRKRILKGGVLVGIALFFASNLQQLGIALGTPAGKAGFLTSCYIVLVPVLGIFLGKKTRWYIWAAIVLAVIGLYFLCMPKGAILTGALRLSAADLFVLLCAVAWAVHIQTVDSFAPTVDPVRLSRTQFLMAAIFSAIPMILIDMGVLTQGDSPFAVTLRSLAGTGGTGSFEAWARSLTIPGVWVSILYTGILSSGIAFTLQIVGQALVEPSRASVYMSLESVFSVLSGWIVLGEHMNLRELLGCLVIFLAVLLAQGILVPQKKEKL